MDMRWLIQAIGMCPLMWQHVPYVSFFKGENLLLPECQSRSAHVLIAGSSGHCSSILNMSCP